MQSPESTHGSLWDRYGFLIVMAVAIALRTIAAIFSKGYMASDDHFQTVSIAYHWLQNGLFNQEGYLTWPLVPSSEISRFPLYTLFLYLLMWLHKAVGVTSLDTMMYGIRAAHAAISLIGVWAVYRIIHLYSRSSRWAALGGMIMAAHFAMPFLAVRNLIEMVGGSLWILALYYLYRNGTNHSDRSIFIAGLISGIAWTIRFQLAFTIAVVPFVLVFEARRLREALVFSAGVAIVLMAAGLTDLWLVGGFMATSLNYLAQSISEGALYSTPLLIYLGVILGLFLPPMSILFFVPVFLRSFWSQHRLLVLSTLVFVLVHALAGNRQERFMLPIFPALTVMVVMAWHNVSSRQLLSRGMRQAAYIALVIAAVVNVVLLMPLTVNYSHKGMVEPMVEVSDRVSVPHVLIVTPEVSRFFPLDYGNRTVLHRRYLNSWENIEATVQDTSFVALLDFVIVYPDREENLPRFLDSLTQHFGPLKPEFEVMPSPLDRLLHLMNPKHNDLEAAWVYSPIR